MFSTISKSKFGDCSKCGLKDTDVVKIKKDLFCLSCNRDMKGKQQIARANQKCKVRSLVTYQRAEGIVDSVSELVIDIDRVASRYIRLRDMEKDGKITCYCCGKRVKWEKAHCMHYINRQHMATRFLIANLHSGCYECNVEKRGNLEVYAAKLNAETPDIVNWLTEQSYTVQNVTKIELKELLFDFQQKLHNVEKKLKTQP